LALVHGNLKEKEGEIVSYLFENKAFRVFSTKDESKGKLSKTGFKVLKESKGLSLLEIQLFTGRKHQIRVHLSEKGNPVVGDKMYGRDEKGKQRLALHSASLKLVHPETKKEISFKTGIPDAFKSNFK
jgi:tRNA pseudouridine32 synthase/23S rRNA pseudouridine746 synthase/23S rRNA pseudouridine1911/1915/1917 synthase